MTVIGTKAKQISKSEIRPVGHLSPRERQVADLLRSGKCAKRIAQILGISVETSRTYVKNVYRALGVNSKVELILLLGVVHP